MAWPVKQVNPSCFAKKWVVLSGSLTKNRSKQHFLNGYDAIFYLPVFSFVFKFVSHKFSFDRPGEATQMGSLLRFFKLISDIPPFLQSGHC